MTRRTHWLLALFAAGTLAGCPATKGSGTQADGGGGAVTDGGTTDGGDGGTIDGGVTDGGTTDGGVTDGGATGQPLHPGASLTGGSGTAASTHYRLRFSVGAPQPAGHTGGGSHQLNTGASPGR